MSDSEDIKNEKPKIKIKTTADVQRLKLEKLMKNPSKPVYIPEMRKEKQFPDAPEFVRNVMGSSAGAGSGEFHVYRHVRRREYSRELYLQAKSDKELLDEEFQRKIEQNQKELEAKTAKKRNKRQRFKMKKRLQKLNKKEPKDSESEDSSSSEEDSNSETENVENDKEQEENSGKVLDNDPRNKPVDDNPENEKS